MDFEQLDLFEHSRAVVLANDLIRALLAADLSEARARVALLAEAEPDNDRLDDFRLLCEGLVAPPPDCSSFAAADASRLHIEETVRPTAERAMGARAGEFLQPLRIDLAKRVPAGFDPAFPNACAAALWLAAGEPAHAEHAVLDTPGWARQPVLLETLALARYRLYGLERAWSAIAALAWHAPGRLGAVVAALSDEVLAAEWRTFRSEIDWDDSDGQGEGAWFPAWRLLRMGAPGTAAADDPVALSNLPAARAWELLPGLLQLEKGGITPALLRRREQLRGLHPAFFDLYMHARRVAKR